ncbi:hypothetical protein MEN41_13510 [Dolichospermum sp. ST_con]|jgi:hypothetical protein|nr:hypothetical protein [Dolichospermum sp. DET66]MBS3033795.1 hypothetical protein [Dolichospermum sp. DET67]MBS3038998.1 hypothetical protein [Dolichospermum sp. DET50]MDD1415610.1 hypothetical protein [Dolichospermum sp. ST_con]MDD1421253.1 hypothetical protein [Dolichospermum sp. ST_sed1]MDD1425608.1 hypothetical protein [Dolichospermum sp. ST_sed9]MDD1434791.1 hypothetical protein [Dolichospermum sp. ST_sed6]MDD1436822.1 hypothetical protein [Dolichospermum sp. ST_sed10]MDD1444127.1 hy
MLDLYDLIRNIQKRPAMYLGRATIANLRTFLAGYCFARRQTAIPQTQQEQEFSGFQNWVQQKYNVTSHQTWDQIILFFSKDENTAFEEFFKLFDEFTQQDSISQHQGNIKISPVSII